MIYRSFNCCSGDRHVMTFSAPGRLDAAHFPEQEITKGGPSYCTRTRNCTRTRSRSPTKLILAVVILGSPPSSGVLALGAPCVGDVAVG